MADQFKFVQNQPSTLAGAGATIGDTSVILSSFQTIDGVNLAMTDFGSIGYGTMEPGSGTQEEQISFSGIVQNANGTATLTGVKSVLFVSPYTETTGLSKTHAGGTQFVISNTAGFYNKLTSKSDDETITGLWDFPSGANNPTIGDVTYVAPTGDTQIATKKYVDDVAIAGAPDATLTVKGILEIGTTAEINAGTSTGGTGASLAVRPDQLAASIYGLQLPSSGQKAALASTTTPSASNLYESQVDFQKGVEIYGTDSVGTDAYAITVTPAIAGYTAGQRFYVKIGTANTGAATLAVGSGGAKAIKKNYNSDLATGDLLAGQIIQVTYDSANDCWQMMSPPAVVSVSAGGATTSGAISSSTTTDVSISTSFPPKIIELVLNPSTMGDAGTALITAVFDQTTVRYWFGLYDQNNALALADFSFTAGTVVVAGTGGNNWSFTITILSVSATGFVVRIASTKTGSPSNSTISIGWKGWS